MCNGPNGLFCFITNVIPRNGGFGSGGVFNAFGGGLTCISLDAESSFIGATVFVQGGVGDRFTVVEQCGAG